jgi:serine/threonine protein kinase/tetratricopeptide (TPR) repeat protein
MNAVSGSGSVRIRINLAACKKCGSTSRVGRGSCLSCLLHSGLDAHLNSAETLDTVLEEVDVRNAEWRLGNYQILEEIGRGGMGVIYRARQRHSRRIVAVKRMLGYHADSLETLARFRREAQAAASLDHPNILPIHEVSEGEDGLPFFSMKFAPGGSLQEVGPALRNEPRQCVALIAKIARAVQYAHGKGILHRDLKPGNILLDGHGEPLVTDFGLAKWFDTTSDLTRTLTIFGTPGYIAPEQARGPAVQLEPAADIYSLGAILFDLLAGRPPFLGSHALSVIRQAAEISAPKLRSLSKVADRDLETICARCLERDPSARYSSAGNFAEDLERWLEGRPITARPVSPPVRLWRWSKRNPKLAGLAAAIVVLGAAGMAAMIASTRLSSIVRRAELAQHSIVITPFEDLDEISTTSNSARSTTSAFAAAIKAAKGIQVSSTGEQSTKGETDPWRPEDWKRIGEAAGARMVLSGSVRAREGKQRVTLHLVETATGSIVNTWLRDAGSISDIARASALEISDILGRSEAHPDDRKAIGGSNNLSARSYYERGKELFFRYNLADQARAIDSFRTAVKIDPNYGQAHAILASACQARSVVDPEGKWLEQAETATAAALRLAPMHPESHRAHAGNLRIKGFLRASLDSYLTAYELDPSNGRAAATLGNVYDFLGRPDLAISWFEKATGREARPFYADNLGDAWMDLGDYAEAEKAYQTAAVFRPDLPTGVLGLSRLALFRGDYENARRQCEDARAKYKDNPQPLIMEALVEFFSRHFDAAEQLYGEALASDRTGGVEFVGSVRFLSAIGFIKKGSTARAKEGRALLEDARTLDKKQLSSAPENPARLYSLAADEAALDHVEAAIASLNQATTVGWIDYRSMELDPRLDSIRDLGAFQEILDRLKRKIETMRRRLPAREPATRR